MGAWQGEQSMGSGSAIVSAGIRDKAENILVVSRTCDLIEAASSHGHLVGGVSCLSR